VRVGKWTLKEVVQGVPIQHPTHPMFVHFPTALYPAALLLGILSRTQSEPAYGRAAALLLGVGLGASVLAAFTGLVDWSGMVPGSTKRSAATRHMLVQLSATVLAGLSFLIHVRDLGTSPSAALVVLGAAVLLMIVGNYLGGILVYRMAMRVSGGSAARAAGAVSTVVREFRRGA
jgi:uncharacterized membrane protein